MEQCAHNGNGARPDFFRNDLSTFLRADLVDSLCLSSSECTEEVADRLPKTLPHKLYNTVYLLSVYHPASIGRTGSASRAS